jgi:hypothetical protein
MIDIARDIDAFAATSRIAGLALDDVVVAALGAEDHAVLRAALTDLRQHRDARKSDWCGEDSEAGHDHGCDKRRNTAGGGHGIPPVPRFSVRHRAAQLCF